MSTPAAVALALAVAVVALERRNRQARAERNAGTYRAGYLDALRDVHRGLLDPEPE